MISWYFIRENAGVIIHYSLNLKENDFQKEMKGDR
jgi:hypothetical protein